MRHEPRQRLVASRALSTQCRHRTGPWKRSRHVGSAGTAPRVRLTVLLLALVCVARARLGDAPRAEPVRTRGSCSTPSSARPGRRSAKAAHGPVVGAITLCEDDAQHRQSRPRARHMGSGSGARCCRRAWWRGRRPRSRPYGTTALKYFTALLDDLDVVGDGKGGDQAASRDSCYPIRNLGAVHRDRVRLAAPDARG